MTKTEAIKLSKALCRCSTCGGLAIIKSNASKQFQLVCEKCGKKTHWTTKTYAIIEWYSKNTIQAIDDIRSYKEEYPSQLLMEEIFNVKK